MSDESLEELLDRLDDEITEGDIAMSDDLRDVLNAVQMLNEKIENRS